MTTFDVPSSWSLDKLGNICTTTSGGTPSRNRKDYFNGNIPWVKSGELTDGLVRDIEEFITDEALSNSSAKIYPAGTLLIALYGATVGKLGMLTRDAASNQAVCAIYPKNGLDSKYLFWYLRYIRSDLISQAIGGAQPNISQTILKNLSVPIAPSSEQTFIVSEIEKQFSRLDEAVAALKRIKANLKRYKASVLKAAVEGKLTEEWRKKHPDVDPASELLKWILVERRRKWEEAELEKMGVKGKEPKDDKWNKRYKEPEKYREDGLYDIPSKWSWTTLGHLLREIKAGKSFKCDERPPLDNETGIVKVSSVTWGEFDELESKTIMDESKINTQYTINPGDFLFSRANTIELVGACVIVNNLSRKLLLSDKILRFDFVNNYKEWILTCLRSRFGRNEIESLATGNQESMRNISQSNINKIRIPLPPEYEQVAIVNEILQRLSILEQFDQNCDVNLKRVERLRQSILKKAFSGSLVRNKTTSMDKELYV